MHDIWNPWHGCIKKSEGCQNCYMMVLDRLHQNQFPEMVFRTKAFSYPLSKKKDGTYKVKSGEMLRVCMTSDFFLEEADKWRQEAWRIINIRKDVIFFLLTKRPERVWQCLPENWGNGYENVFFNITCENQMRLEERIPYLRDLPFRHKGIMTAPLLGPIRMEQYLREGFIEQVICGGENYGGTRPCDFDWVKDLSLQCQRTDTTFAFIETGTNFIKDGKTYRLYDKRVQSQMAYKSETAFRGRNIEFDLRDCFDNPIPKHKLYSPQYTGIYCKECGSRGICNGCANCGKCPQKEGL